MTFKPPNSLPSIRALPRRCSIPMLLVCALVAACAASPDSYEVDGQKVRGADAGARLITTTANASSAAQTPNAAQSPTLVHSVAPSMPREAITFRIEGDVLARLSVNRDGKVTEVTILKSPHKLLSDAVAAAMRMWVFTPLVVNGAPQAFVVQQTYTFRSAP